MTSGSSSGPDQSLSFCIVLMLLSGVLRVMATMALAYPQHQARLRGESLEANQRFSLVAFHVVLLTVAAVLGIIGTIYGPVAIAVPVQTGSQLLFNIIAMGLVLKMRCFDKIHRTGTYVVSLSVLSLVDVGPGTQEGQDIPKLLSSPGAILWILLISAVLLFATVETIRLLQRQRNERLEGDDSVTGAISTETRAFLVLLSGVTMSNVVMASCGKFLGYLEGGEFNAAFLCYLVASLLGLLFSITSATTCDQGLFTPACASALIVVNMITGIIIWEDGKAINTWVGYICACLLTCCGVYLLAEVDLIKQYYLLRDGIHDDLSLDANRPAQESLEGSRRLVSVQDDGSGDYSLLDLENALIVSLPRSMASSEALDLPHAP